MEVQKGVFLEDSVSSVGKRLRRERLRLGMTQEMLAEALGTTTRSIRRWECGEVLPYPYYRTQLCQMFNVSASVLFETDTNILYSQLERFQIWNVPCIRNIYFTGRESIITHIYNIFYAKNGSLLRKIQCICGLGGIGKTQIALEYAYRYRSSYSAVLWVQADTQETLMSEFMSIATRLQLFEKGEHEPMQVVEAVKKWFNEHENWLLVFDGVEDFPIISYFLPTSSHGHILLTTQSQAVGTLAQPLYLQSMQVDEGALFLLRRAKLINFDVLLDNVSEEQRMGAYMLASVMGGLPLALDQVGAYIEETSCSFVDYYALYHKCQDVLLTRRGMATTNHPTSIMDTILGTLKRLESMNVVAANLLRLCIFLHFSAIPEEMFSEEKIILISGLEPLIHDPFALNNTFQELLRFSLIQRASQNKTFSIHPLVQAIILQSMSEDMRLLWVERAIKVVNHMFTEGNSESTSLYCERYISHVQYCTTFIIRWKLCFPEAINLLFISDVLKQRDLLSSGL